MKRKIGFGFRFCALVIDVTILIVLVFVLFSLFGSSLYYSIGVIKKKAPDASATVSSVIKRYFTGADASSPAASPSAANNRTESREPAQNSRPAAPERMQTRNQLPEEQMVIPDEAGRPGAGSEVPQSIVPREQNTDKLASKIHKGYIHNSKDFVKIFFFSILAILYFLIEGLKGFSVGKIIMRLKIFNEAEETAPFKVLFIRYSIKMLIPCLFMLLYAVFKLKVFWFLGIVWFFLFAAGCFFVFSNTLQALHDRIAKTAVFSLFLKKEDLTEAEN
jgi:uncharacterized RDD family membrane protein YckC